jgi:transcription antitermination factor NusG
MDSYNVPDGAWIAVQVHCGSEVIVRDGLRQRRYEEFVPLYAKRVRQAGSYRTVSKVLFPCYIFCRYIARPAYRIVEIPNVVRLVGIGKVPLRIPDAELEAIRRVVDSGLYSMPWRFLAKGQRIIVNRGPLLGVRGHLIEVRNDLRLVVSVQLLGRAVAVEIGSSDVSPDNGLDSAQSTSSCSGSAGLVSHWPS